MNKLLLIPIILLVLSGCGSSNVSDSEVTRPDIFSLVKVASYASEMESIEYQYNAGIINKSEADAKILSLKKEMEENGTASMIKSWSSNTRILNANRFYQLSQCDIKKGNFKCKDGLESYEGSGRVYESFFLPKGYETFAMEDCMKISQTEFKCTTEDGSGYQGLGINVEDKLFLPKYPK